MERTGWQGHESWPGWRRDLGWLLLALAVAVPILFAAHYAAVSIPPQDATADLLAEHADRAAAARTHAWLGLAAAPAIAAAGALCLTWSHRTRAVA